MEVFTIPLVRVPAVETEGDVVVLISPNELTVAMQWMKPHSGHRRLRRLGCAIEVRKDQKLWQAEILRQQDQLPEDSLIDRVIPAH
jgi:hypothetical protein